MKKSLAGREPKNFCSWGRVAGLGPKPPAWGAKVFLLLFFQKKKTLPFFRLLRIQPPHDGCGTVRELREIEARYRAVDEDRAAGHQDVA